MLWSIDSCQNRVSVDQYHVTVSLVQVLTHRDYVFLKVSADKLVDFNGSQAQLDVDFFERVTSLLFEKNINYERELRLYPWLNLYGIVYTSYVISCCYSIFHLPRGRNSSFKIFARSTIHMQAVIEMNLLPKKSARNMC